MKKLINTAFGYALLSLTSGVIYREVTRFADYTEKTSLSSLHLHFFALGSLIFLILALFEGQFSITQNKLFSKFYIIYNAGLLSMGAMFLYRGLDQVYGWNGGAMVSGIAGLTHILFSIGVVMLFLLLKQSTKEKV